MDLKALSSYNSILKYADDTSILVPQHSSISIEEEFQNVQTWSIANKLQINLKKRKKSFLDVLLHEISLHLSLYLSLNSSQLLNFWEYCTVTMKIHARSSQILTQAGIATSGLLSAWRFIRWTMMVNKTVPTVVTITNVTYISTNICHNCHNDGFLKQLILCIVPIVHYIS